MDIKTKPVAVMCFSSGTGGMERSAVRLAETLSRVSKVVLVCKRGSFVEQLYQQGSYPFKCESVGFASRTFSPAMLFGVRAIIDAHQIHNVIFFGASELKTLYFSFMGKLLNVTVWHGTTKSRPKRDAIHNQVYSCVDHHVAISKHLDRNVRQIVPVRGKAEYRVIRPSFTFADDIQGKPGLSDPQCLNIVHVGRVAHGKGQIDAVLACRGLYEAGVKFALWIVGGGEKGEQYMDELIRVVESLPYKESIYLKGYVDDVNEYLKKADVFLFPSSGEGMPGSYIEALHHGLICVSYDNTVFPEFQDMGFYTHIVENQRVDKLSDKLCELASDILSEKQKVNDNIHLSRKCFSTEREINDWLEVLE
ncbi:MAG: glycosyltransferase family 4 protein [Gammaproteobacteria bacterium]|nr:glycosyltransferase family 4 protein [Gammaproteobacteria bacterium]